MPEAVPRDARNHVFRPDRSVGVWAIGEVAENLWYRAMAANGFNAADLRFDQLDQDLVYSVSTWYEPLGDFGRGWSDVEGRDAPVVRIGNSFTFGTSNGDSRGVPIQERNFLRLSDGSRPTDGELAPGLTIDRFDRFLYAVDLGWKYRGWSMDGEYYFRWIDDLQGNRPVPRPFRGSSIQGSSPRGAASSSQAGWN